MSTKVKAWTVLATAYLATFAVAFNQFKVPPVMMTLMDELKVDMSTGGWLMSIFTVMAVILAIPAALLLAKLGPKIAGLI